MTVANKKIGYKRYSSPDIKYSKRMVAGRYMRYLSEQEVAEWFAVVEKACKKLKRRSRFTKDTS